MKEKLKCIIKRKSGHCIWQEIESIDQKIYEKKHYYHIIASAIDSFKQHILNQEYVEILTKPIPLYDGFTKTPKASFYLKRKTLPKCPYMIYDCHDLYQLKQNVYTYHQEQIIKKVESYHQLVQLIYKARNLYQERHNLDHTDTSNKLEKNKEPLPIILSLQESPYWALRYSDFKRNKAGALAEIEHYYMMIDSFQQVACYHLHIINDPNHEILSGTSIYRKPLGGYILEVIGKKWPTNLKCCVSLIDSLTTNVQLYHQKHIKDDKPIWGLYINLSQLECRFKKQLIKHLEPKGYQVIGKVVHGAYKEAYYMIWKT